MTIFVKNKHTLQIDDFYFKCSIGKKGVTKRKKDRLWALSFLFFSIKNRYIFDRVNVIVRIDLWYRFLTNLKMIILVLVT